VGPPDVVTDFGEVGQPKRCAMLRNQFHQGNPVELQLCIIGEIELLLRPVERLFDEIDILQLHFAANRDLGATLSGMPGNAMPQGGHCDRIYSQRFPPVAVAIR